MLVFLPHFLINPFPSGTDRSMRQTVGLKTIDIGSAFPPVLYQYCVLYVTWMILIAPAPLETSMASVLLWFGVRVLYVMTKNYIYIKSSALHVSTGNCFCWRAKLIEGLVRLWYHFEVTWREDGCRQTFPMPTERTWWRHSKGKKCRIDRGPDQQRPHALL